MIKFSSDIQLPFPNSNDLNSRGSPPSSFNPIKSLFLKKGLDRIGGGGGESEGCNLELQARGTERKIKEMSGTQKGSNIHRNQTAFADCLTIQELASLSSCS